MKTNLWKTQVGEISITEAGQGTPLLAVHGVLSSSVTFTPLLERPPRDCRVIAMDLPGHGRSPAASAPCDGWEAMSRWVVAVMDLLELETVHLIGHSMGGGICAFTAAEHPEKVNGLILIDSATMPFSLPLKARIPLIPVIGELVFKYFYRESMFFSYFRNDVFFDERNLDKERILTYYSAFDRHRESILHSIRATSDPRPVALRLKKIACPTLVVWGQDDPLLPLVVGEQTAAEVPQATLERIEKCGHSPFDEAPEETCRIITAFWENSLLPLNG